MHATQGLDVQRHVLLSLLLHKIVDAEQARCCCCDSYLTVMHTRPAWCLCKSACYCTKWYMHGATALLVMLSTLD